jgi:hypothetical protein
MFPLLMSAVAMSMTRPATELQTGKWLSDDFGQTAVFRMQNTPYPHKSRDNGFKIEDKFYPREPHYVDNSVGIFIPKSYQPQQRVDLLIYFHGHYNNVRKAMDEFHLREQVIAAGKSVILVFPQGPKDAGDSGGGKLEEPGGLKRLADEVLDTLDREGRIKSRNLGRVLLAGHSGAYRVISFCLQHGGLEDHISAVCLLDASYDRLDAFVDWAARNPAHRLLSVFTDHLAVENVYMITQLRKRSVAYDLLDDADATDAVLDRSRLLFLHTTRLDHYQTVQWLERWLKASPLSEKPPTQPAGGK